MAVRLTKKQVLARVFIFDNFADQIDNAGAWSEDDADLEQAVYCASQLRQLARKWEQHYFALLAEDNTQ